MGLKVSVKFSGIETEAVKYVKDQSLVGDIADATTLTEIQRWINNAKTDPQKINDFYKVYNAYSSIPYDGQMRCNYCYIFNDPDLNIADKVDYSEIIDSSTISDTISPIMLNYKKDEGYGVVDAGTGITLRDIYSGGYSFYRREYNEYSRYNGYDEVITDEGTKLVPHKEEYEFIGEWEPAAVLLNKTAFRDFNVKSGHSYQYILYPANASVYQVFANSNDNQEEGYTKWGEPVVVN